jgi:hypothetical protein
MNNPTDGKQPKPKDAEAPAESEVERQVGRREFLKISGVASAAIGGIGLGAFGYAAGKDPHSHLGWQNQEGASQTFNRKRYEVDEPTYERVGPTDRPDARVENIFSRRGRFMRQYRQMRSGGVMDDEVLAKYYEEHPEDRELDTLMVEEIFPKLRQDMQEYGDQYKLAVAWADAMFAVGPDRPFPSERG